MGTDKQILNKGISYFAYALPLLFIGPSIIHSAFKNQHTNWHYVVLAVGIAMCIGAVYLMFKGLRTIIKSMFGN
ncbi:MAG TPA: DUF6095 family protein [Flavobacterium sp.]|jgi:drug/metabolite transporter (DMT)-like permease